MPVRNPSSLVGDLMVPSESGDGRDVIAEPKKQQRASGIASSSSSLESHGSLSWDAVRGRLVSAGALWLVGFWEACQFHRTMPFFKRSRPVLIKTGQCFLLNGFLFLGSILILQHIFIPTLRWFLGSSLQLPAESGKYTQGNWRTGGVLQTVIIGICYVFWLYPLYLVSFVVNIIWYNDIAKHAFQTMDKAGVYRGKVHVEGQDLNSGKGTVPAKGRVVGQNSSGIQSAVLLIGEQIYSVVMLSAFFVEVFAASYIPYVGPLLNFVLLTWLYAYYCFDYKWGLARWSLERRLLFFESNWAFFSGFGSPCVIATFFLSPFVSAGVMNILFPLFVLVATASDPEKAVLKYTGSHSFTTMTRLPIFYFANILMVPLLRFIQPAMSTMPSSIQSRKVG